MKNNCEKTLRRLVCYGLTLTLMLSPAFSVFAEDEVAGMDTQDAAQTVHETGSEEAPDPIIEEVPEAAPAQADNTYTDTGGEETEPVSEASSTQEITENNSDTVSGTAPEAAAAAETGAKGAGENTPSGPIRIGDTSFSYEDEESSHWTDGKGWKNVSGQYVAMVDYDGSKAEISADGGVVTLAVAGVNRIGALKGDCSYRIAGSGIVLIDSIEIENGNTLTLHPNSAVYNDGSAAVFLKQDDDSYLLINGSVTGMLDDIYELNNVDLVIPKGSSLTIGALAVRTELWSGEDTDGLVSDITIYTEDPPSDFNHPVHENGTVETEGFTGKFVLGKNSTLTVSDGASIKLKKLSTGLSSVAAELIIQGALNAAGIVEGGFVNISDGGSISGNGTIRSSEVTLDPDGKISEDILLENSGLTIKGDRSITPPQLKDSIIYLKGSTITIPELTASGVSRIGVETIGESYGLYTIKDIILSSGSSIEVVCNDHQSAAYDFSEVPRYLEDSFLTISGAITGGAVYVLGGCVIYTGAQTDNIPFVPAAYASRVYVSNANNNSSDAPVSFTSSDFPINIAYSDAAARADSETIPVMYLKIMETLVSDDVLARSWNIDSYDDTLSPLVREDGQSFNSVSEFLETYNLTGESNDSTYQTAVELIYSDLSRKRIFLKENTGFDTKNVILIRILDITGQGGQGGSSMTHTSASLTGSGVIGGPGSGSVKAGNGKVVFSNTSYKEPEPTPDPTPDPSPKPTPDPKPDNKGGKKKAARVNAQKAVASAVSAGGLVVSVYVLELAEEDAVKESQDMPRIWHLDVTDAGVPVENLTGNPVTVTIPFTVPDSWGDPAKIDNKNLYAVFADDEGVLTAYSAQYDPLTGEVSFDAEQTGDYVITQFEYNDEPFTEEFYRALADTDEIKAFLYLISLFF